MMYLGEHRTKPDRLSDLLPWAALVAPGVVLNKDGSFLRVIKFRGPDLDSSTEPQVRNRSWPLPAAGASRSSVETESAIRSNHEPHEKHEKHEALEQAGPVRAFRVFRGQES